MKTASPSGRFGLVDQASNPTAPLRLPEVKAERACVGNDVPSDCPGGIPPHGIGLGHDLVGYQDYGVLDVCYLLEFLHVTVQLLLSGS